jgi:hypothetical protein
MVNGRIPCFLSHALLFCVRRQFNPLNGLFCEGDVNDKGTPWIIRSGIYKKSATRVAGVAITFTCPADFYPVVDTAERRIWMCTQRLSVLMRLPCAKNENSCTVDYAKKYGEAWFDV